MLPAEKKYPKECEEARQDSFKWFSIFVAAAPALVLCLLLGPKTALGAGIGTMFLSFGHTFTFGGLLATLPSQDRFDEFKRSLKE